MLEANEVLEAFSGTSQTAKAWGDLFQKHHNLVEGDDIFPSTFVPYAVARSMKNVAEKEKATPARRSLSVVLEIIALGGPINHLRFAKSRGYSYSPLWRQFAISFAIFLTSPKNMLSFRPFTR